ncbi:hypothetical protein [Allomuricauda sp. SCSIO 64092]|nr:hypothetical protein [Muricauda sp. SCSIO 64092]
MKVNKLVGGKGTVFLSLLAGNKILRAYLGNTKIKNLSQKKA